MIPTFSPQGDGNLTVPLYPLIGAYMVDPYLFPARGRKLVYLTKIEFVKTNVDPYLFPARGRKLACLPPPEPPTWVAVDPYLFPARGRKRLGLLNSKPEPILVDPYLFPARGRKPYVSGRWAPP